MQLASLPEMQGIKGADMLRVFQVLDNAEDSVKLPAPFGFKCLDIMLEGI
jgi:hypothetical protein